jgi:beta-glucanase (GH16 family)
MKKKYYLLFLFFVVFKIHAQSWALIWSDEFTASKIDSTNWNFETGAGGWGNNELEYYTNRLDNAIIKNGSLNIIAKKEQYGGSKYTSARMTTESLRYLTYGKVEAKIKLPSQQGIWPAFWMLGQNNAQVSWPKCGEIDILEHINKEIEVYGTMHWDNNGQAQFGGQTTCNVNTYHVYSIEWDSTIIRWLIDGKQYFSANIKNNINNTAAFHKPFFVILNVAVGGDWPGSPDNTTVFSDTMLVDYVRFYQLATPPSTPVISTSSSLTICQGDSLTLTSSMANSYLWSTGETTQSIVVKVGGSYTVKGGNGLGVTSVSAPALLTLIDLPLTPTIATKKDTLVSNFINGNKWYFNGNIILGANQQSYVALQNGKYTVKVTNGSGCKAVSEMYEYFNTAVNIQNLIFNTSLAIIPNPNNGLFRIETKGLQVSKIKMYNVLGEIIYETNIQNKEINISSQPKGTYFIVFYIDNKIYHKKILIQ